MSRHNTWDYTERGGVGGWEGDHIRQRNSQREKTIEREREELEG